MLVAASDVVAEARWQSLGPQFRHSMSVGRPESLVGYRELLLGTTQLVVGSAQRLLGVRQGTGTLGQLASALYGAYILCAVHRDPM